MSDNREADSFVAAARRIRSATSVSEIASAALLGVSAGYAVPQSQLRIRGFARHATEATLRHMHLRLAQREVASLEVASDLRLETRRRLARILTAVPDSHHIDELTELAVSRAAQICAGAMVSRAQEVLQRQSSIALAVCSLGGSLLISGRAHEFASTKGLDNTALETLLHRAADPIRRACDTPDVCDIGELRFTVVLAESDISAIAHLDGTFEGLPMIMLRLADAAAVTLPQTPGAVESADTRYPARLLRRLVS